MIAARTTDAEAPVKIVKIMIPTTEIQNAIFLRTNTISKDRKTAETIAIFYPEIAKM